MDFKKPSTKTATDTAALAGGILVGGAVSRGVYGAIHEKKATVAAEIATETKMGYAKRAGIIILAGVGAAALTGTGAETSFAKGALLGMASVQALDGIKEVAATSTATAKYATSTTATGKFMARTLGLACPCDEVNPSPFQSQLGRPRYSRLRSPMLEANNAIGDNSLDALFMNARNQSV